MGETISFEEFCAILQNLIGRVVEQKASEVIRRGTIQQAQTARAKGFGKSEQTTIQLSVPDFRYWSTQERSWTDNTPLKLGNSNLPRGHIALYSSQNIFVFENGTIKYGSVIIYPAGTVPDNPTVT